MTYQLQAARADEKRLIIMPMILALALLLFIDQVVESTQEEAVASQASTKGKGMVFSKKNTTSAFSGRKLLQSTDEGDIGNRIGMECSKDDIVILQGTRAPLPNGIPSYSVEILNVRMSGTGCSISNIHVSCGWFSSVRLINPTVFRRLYYDDCLVNDGEALAPGQCLSFQYANTFSYPLSVSSVACC